MFGTKEGLKKVFDFYDERSKRIAAKCNPQDVSDYEWNNHECMISYEDEEAMRIVVGYFGMEIAKTVKRKYAYLEIEKLV